MGKGVGDVAQWGSVSILSWEPYNEWLASEQRRNRITIISTPTSSDSLFEKYYQELKESIWKQIAVPKELLCKGMDEVWDEN